MRLFVATKSYVINMRHVVCWKELTGNLVFKMDNGSSIYTTCPFQTGNDQLSHLVDTNLNYYKLKY